MKNNKCSYFNKSNSKDPNCMQRYFVFDVILLIVDVILLIVD